MSGLEIKEKEYDNRIEFNEFNEDENTEYSIELLLNEEKTAVKRITMEKIYRPKSQYRDYAKTKYVIEIDPTSIVLEVRAADGSWGGVLGSIRVNAGFEDPLPIEEPHKLRKTIEKLGVKEAINEILGYVLDIVKEYLRLPTSSG